jgi:hypothetical protein
MGNSDPREWGNGIRKGLYRQIGTNRLLGQVHIAVDDLRAVSFSFLTA